MRATPGPDPLDPALAAARVSYEAGALDEADLAPAPLAQFRRWYDDAVAAGLPEPNPLVLATPDGAPPGLSPGPRLRRRVGVGAGVGPVPREESAAYFASRPWASRIGAWA